jgi:hypothetical protein
VIEGDELREIMRQHGAEPAPPRDQVAAPPSEPQPKA